MQISGWDVGAVCAKALTYAAALGAAGAIFFLAYTAELLEAQQQRRLRRLIGILVLLAALGSVARILLLTGSMSGDLGGMFDSELTAMILHAGEGWATGARLAGLLLCLCALFSHRGLRTPALLGAAIAATSFAWVGHIHALWPNALPTIASCLHLIGVAFWLGALTPLLLIARDNHQPQVAAVTARFGKFAVGVVAALMAAGLTMLWLLSANAADFWSSAYGRMVALKLLLVTLLLGAAAWNKLSLTPRLGGDAAAVYLLRRSITVEIVLGLLILLLTACFTTLVGPPRA